MKAFSSHLLYLQLHQLRMKNIKFQNKIQTVLPVTVENPKNPHITRQNFIPILGKNIHANFYTKIVCLVKVIVEEWKIEGNLRLFPLI